MTSVRMRMMPPRGLGIDRGTNSLNPGSLVGPQQPAQGAYRSSVRATSSSTISSTPGDPTVPLSGTELLRSRRCGDRRCTGQGVKLGEEGHGADLDQGP